MTQAHKSTPAVDIITMGCSKNLIDSERLMHMFEQAGFKAYHNPSRTHRNIVIINTCGFIGDAKQESIDMILQCCRDKARNRFTRVYVMGCLSQRYADQLPAEIPEVDGWYGKFDWNAIIADISAHKVNPDDWHRTLTTPPYQAYLKIAEGCNRFCAYCAIPLITGRYVSRPIDQIIEEVKYLVSTGVKEFNVIAQDLTYYGRDIYGAPRIAELVDKIARIDGVEWIRLHYAYPTDFPLDLLDVMAKHPNVCKYLDIALQHINDRVLTDMHRHIDAASTRQLLRTIREKVPGIHLRTTMMVGFPGETDAEFEELCDFVREQRFERLGAFAYCAEDDTYADTHYTDDVPPDVKDARLDRLMAIQQDIALEVNQAKVGSRIRVIIDSVSDDHYIGRSEFDSPEVDPEVLVEKSVALKPGDFCMVEITDAAPFELFAKPI